MAAPRVFVSSTFYDLQYVRNDIHSFLQSIGYEPVMHDKGSLTYSQNEPLEESCYSEVDTCDIVVCIIGGHYGSTSATRPGKSITMNEIESAIKKNKLIYIYILKNVYSEYQTFEANKCNQSFTPFHADDIKVLKFISELTSKVHNHPIEQFETSTDIIDKLRQQFAGKFQQLLQRQTDPPKAKTIEDLDDRLSEIKTVVQQATSDFDEITSKIKGSIFFPLQPVRFIMEKLSLKKFNVYMDSVDSLNEFLTALGYEYDDFLGTMEGTRVYENRKNKYKLTISNELFDNGMIKDIRLKDQLEKYIMFEEMSVDDLPF